MKTIPLTRGYFAIVDDEDYEDVSRHKWWVNKVNKTFYAARVVRIFKGGPRYRLYLHVALMGTRPGVEVDHRSRNGLDNRRENLRWATKAQNCVNRKSRVGRSGYRGVTKRRSKWQAQIKTATGRLRIGLYDSPEAGARAYDEAARRFHGEFAVLNFP